VADALNIVFAGTPAFAATHLHALIDSPHTLMAVLTQPDRPAGRGKKLATSPVKALALSHDIPVWQPNTLRDSEVQTALSALAPDVLIVVAYGLLLPQAVLDIPRLGCLNVHGSLLPRWRGAAPVQRAIAAGDAQTGVCIMRMEAGLDTGPVLAKKVVHIANADTTGSLMERLAETGGALLTDTLSNVETYLDGAQEQDHAAATYAHKIEKAEGQINWSWPARDVDRLIRALHPTPGCFSHHDTLRFKIWRAVPVPGDSCQTAGTIIALSKDGMTVQCGEGALQITELQLAGGKALPIAALLNGGQLPMRTGDRLSQLPL
jgi:methionyl-tRNA formyltransferase